MSCCGKIVGCIYAPVYDNHGNVVTEKTCPFCRTSIATSTEEIIKSSRKLVENGNIEAIFSLGCPMLQVLVMGCLETKLRH